MQYDNAGNIIGDFTPKAIDIIGKPVTQKKTLRDYENQQREEDNKVKRNLNYRDVNLQNSAFSYPLSDKGNHYIRFWINLDEESKLIKESRVLTNGTIDNTDQNRLNQSAATQSSVNNTAALGGAVTGASLALNYIPAAAKKFYNIDLFKGKGIGSAASLGGVIAGSGAVVGAVTGAGISALNADTFKLNKRLKRLVTSISLYTPSAISTSYNMNWGMTDDKLIDFAQAHQQEAIGNAIKNRPAGETISKFLRVAMSASSEAFSNLGRTAVNPKRDVLFNSVGNRHFKFDYVFAPRSKEEAIEVSNIIYAFKLFAHPELIAGYAQYLYLYPAEFDIEYRMIDANGNDIENPHLNRISSCVLESIDVVYAPNGSFQSLANGEPVITNMSLSFMEIETLHQDKIKQGF